MKEDLKTMAKGLETIGTTLTALQLGQECKIHAYVLNGC
jgi:hypothetical protein